MKNLTLSLSVLLGAALFLPSLAMAAPKKPMPAHTQTVTADSTLEADSALENETLQNDVENNESKPTSIQSSAIEISETKTFSRSRASTNNQNSTEVEATASEAETMQEAPEEMQVPEEDMEDSQETM